MAYSRVPTTRDVVPGARVNIVLKVDQPTGRTVSGTVKDVLTRGDHHRGIKVRLADGRIGRVQTMAASDGQSHEDGGADAEVADVPPESETNFTPRGRRGQHRSQRRTEPEEPPAQQIGLDAYVKQKKPRGKGARKSATEQADESASNEAATTSATEDSKIVACPVCGSFTGDESAVAHHVASHFD